MKNVLVISDTHLKRPDGLPQKIIEQLNIADLAIHAGDVVTLDVLNGLRDLTKVVAVCGNMDQDAVRNALKTKTTIQIEGLKIGIIHGAGSPNNIEYRIRSEFTDVQIIIYGHSHLPVIDEWDDIIMFNPGSAIDNRFTPQPTFGWMVLDGVRFTGQIISLDGVVLKEVNRVF